MPIALLKYGLSRKYPVHGDIPPTPDLKPSYDVVIVGGGGHGLASAHYLAKYWGITNVAVFEKGYLAGGNTARNTTAVRSNYMTQDSIRFYRETVQLFEGLSQELGFNVMFAQRGQFTLAQSESAIRTFHLRAEMGKLMGTRIEVVDQQGVLDICPFINLDRGGANEILAGLWHADGGTARHDAVAWGFAAEAAKRGVEIHQRTEVTGFTVEGDRATEIHTNRGKVRSGHVIQACAGLNYQVAKLAGISLPIRTFPLQAMVTQPVKPLFNAIISAANMHAYVIQSARGELIIGGGTDPYQLFSTRVTLDLKEHLAEAIVHLFPFLQGVKVMRQWAGMTDMTPDYTPIMGASPLRNYWLDCGWGTYGFKATPVSGKYMAQAVAKERTPEILEPFSLERFKSFSLVNEMAATAARG